jgi:hypothetical protein
LPSADAAWKNRGMEALLLSALIALLLMSRAA